MQCIHSEYNLLPFGRVATYEPQNKMSVQNLALVFGPTLIRPRADDIE